MASERKYYLDYLRIGAILAVVLMHCSGHCDNAVSTNDFQWHLCSIPQTVTCWAVPVFIMISGALMLNKDISIKSLYTKNILRLVVAYVFWAFLYVLVFAIIPYYDRLTIDVIKNIIAGIAEGGYYHLWFMPLIIGLYIVLPVFQSAIRGADDKTMNYWFLICFIFGVIIPSLRFIPIFEDMLGSSLDTFNVGFTGHYLLYFMLGYVLDRIEIQKRKRTVLYLMGLSSMAVTIVVVSIQSYYNGCLFDVIRSNKMPTVMIISAALFVAAKEYYTKKKRNIRCEKIVVTMSSLSFGVYLCHMFCVSIFEKPVLAVFSPFMATFVLFFLVSSISFLLIALVRKCALLSKYIT